MATEEQFVRTISAFSGVAGLRIDFVMRKLALDAFTGVLKRSPVDSGRFRASWRIGLNRVDESVEPESESGGGPAKGTPPTGGELKDALPVIRRVKRKDVLHISNSLPYAVRLENGYSGQAPNGMVAPTVVEIETGIRRAVEASKKAVPDVG